MGMTPGWLLARWLQLLLLVWGFGSCNFTSSKWHLGSIAFWWLLGMKGWEGMKQRNRHSRKSLDFSSWIKQLASASGKLTMEMRRLVHSIPGRLLSLNRSWQESKQGEASPKFTTVSLLFAWEEKMLRKHQTKTEWVGKPKHQTKKMENQNTEPNKKPFEVFTLKYVQPTGRTSAAEVFGAAWSFKRSDQLVKPR